MGAYTLLQDLTVATSTTSVVMNSIGTLTKDDFYKVVMTIINPTSTEPAIRITANSSVSTNFTVQGILSGGTTIVADKTNTSNINIGGGPDTSNAIAYLKLSQNDRFNYFSNYTYRNSGSGLRNSFLYGTSSGATFTSGITSLTFTSTVTNAIGTGSRIQIYKLDAVKVADITVTSNTTQVDISNLSIDKDSEYLLVSDLDNALTTDVFYNLFVNDNTTATNYHSQRISAAGAAASAGRLNTANYTIAGPNTIGPNVVYSHIKLSNIGAYTSQNYTQIFSGSSSIQMWNAFVSSTAENITSITKLNIVSATANAIRTGSRFTLYKLYE